MTSSSIGSSRSSSISSESSRRRLLDLLSSVTSSGGLTGGEVAGFSMMWPFEVPFVTTGLGGALKGTSMPHGT